VKNLINLKNCFHFHFHFVTKLAFTMDTAILNLARVWHTVRQQLLAPPIQKFRFTLISCNSELGSPSSQDLTSSLTMASFYNGDNVQAVVADLGHYSTKIGWAGDDYPRSYFRSVSTIGRRRTRLLYVLRSSISLTFGMQ
jgi:hypothetical protein